ncbi:phosphatase PAP2 family protein [Microbacterium sp. CGR2]|uniref:phosphatase PAP2 family protein n=1 Tax=Microbacterium sp. CGR2 TaxID=1805820 RepID=UPI000EA8FBA4|nr:phosphatase PAP2 family protein [Microbacterium sp. CGR2]RKN68932.1 phosphatase PAP2 family protein [Microbacterium sp. CGR2]
MASHDARRSGSPAPQSSSHDKRWLFAAAAAVVVLVISYVLAVLTQGGQALENAALRGADQANSEELSAASQALGDITVVSLAVAATVVALIGLLRRRIDLAIAGVGVIVLGQVITQTLKRFVLPRPALVDVTGDFVHNSFPSGHTTIAMTVLFAALIVVPYRWRGVTLFLTLTWAVGIGAFTVTAKWHRLSDTLGADAVALLCACLASWWLARKGVIVPYTGPTRRGRIVLGVLLSCAAVGFLALGAFLWMVPTLRGVDYSMPNEATDYTAYLGAHALAVGFTAVTALQFWALWHRLETRGADPRTT